MKLSQANILVKHKKFSVRSWGWVLTGMAFVKVVGTRVVPQCEHRALGGGGTKINKIKFYQLS